MLAKAINRKDGPRDEYPRGLDVAVQRNERRARSESLTAVPLRLGGSHPLCVRLLQ